MSRLSAVLVLLFAALAGSSLPAADGNRLAYLDGPLDPYYPHRDFPKLITPQWVGEDGVECVVTLAIDDMRESAKYETFLRPILNRLKAIDGRAAVSIMTCKATPDDPQIQAWLKEGLSIEVHTFDHPCPLLQDGGLTKAKETYDKCVDLLNQIPGNKPVAFRMPCCDSKNTPSPRFWAEIFNKTTEKGNFLQIDSSVFNIITNKDKDLPKEITELPDGTERFRRYVPFANFVNTIEDYPYSYIIGGTCWEFPCVVPSDWSAQHVQKPNNPDTLRDWKLALDACVLKQGVFNLVFHPHGWIKNDQIIELIDHAVTKHGKKVKFLTFKECAEKLNATTAGRTLRAEPEIQSRLAKDASVRLIDINGDGNPDKLFSNHERYSLHLFKDMKEGWSIKVFDVVRGKEDDKSPVLPPFVRADGTNNGAWFHSGALWLMNEDTWRLPDNVFKLTFADMLESSPLAPRGTDQQKTAPQPECCGQEPAAGNEEPSRAVLGTQYSVLSTQPPTNPALQRQSQIPNPKSTSPLNPEPRTLNPPPSSDARYDSLEITRPLSPEESLKALHVRPGMKVELVAAEPLIVDPVAFDWGPDGRLWVVEMRDYPSGITWKKEGDEFGKPGGRVKVLTDVDGDGRYDKAATFLDELAFPTGIKVWRKGILVTAAPDIIYAEDKDGDDKADEQKVLYRGFGEGNQQHRVNGLRWGLDNWLHVGNGDSGGVIRSLNRILARSASEGPATPTRSVSEAAATPTRSVSEGREINVNGRDLRIRPDTGDLDATSGNTQFGRERDDWGNWFGNNNSNPLWHYTLDDHYLRRNPHLTPPSVKKDVSVTPGAAPVFPRSKTLTRFNDDNKANRYTSACGPMIYRDDLLGPEYYGNSFVCEPVHNLVSREIVTPQGSTFTSKRAADEQKSEFLASEDSWFRPSMVRTGPDGAVWVADMYRFVIEHPKWIPLAAQKKLDLRAGDDKGRIYRIYPEGKQPRPIARLDKLDTLGLVAALDSPNGPQRDLAHQMLIWSGDQAAVGPLQKMVGAAPRPQTRVQALCTLEGLGAVNPDSLVIWTINKEPAVRKHVVRLSEPWFDKHDGIMQFVGMLAFEEDVTVRMQVAYSLGESTNKRAANFLGSLLIKNASDPLLTAAALSSLNQGNIEAAVRKLVRKDEAEASADVNKLLERVLVMAVAMNQDSLLATAMVHVLSPQTEGGHASWQYSTVAAVQEALLRRKSQLGGLLNAEGQMQLQEMLASARKSLSETPEKVVQQIQILARGLDGSDNDDLELLSSLLKPQRPPHIKSAALAGLSRTGRSEVPTLLLTTWSAHSPSLRNEILDALAAREDWSLALLSAIEAGQIPQTQLDARRRQQLLTARSKAVRERAEKVFAVALNPDRQKLIETYLQTATSSSGDAPRGQVSYAKRCANCHRLAGQGHAVGPDLSPLTNRPAEYLLTSILDPNRAVEDRYLEYVALTTDGRQLTGILLEETGASLTLAAPEGKKITLPRSELEQIKSSGKSLMPEGVERDVPPAEMTDILAYLKSNAPPPKQLALNQPEVVQPFNDGSIRLFASNCRAYGPTIKMEETWRALGWWNSQEDHCAWSFEVPVGSAGEYRVTLEYSCADNSAGNTAVVEVAGQALTGEVASSGGWDRFRGWSIGTVKLPEGASELVVRSSGPLKRALFDLGGIRLVPTKK